MSRTTLKGASGVASLLRRLCAGLILVSCGGAVNGPSTGGESHFLRFCDSTCGNGLDCISGVCTRGCITGSPSCGGLAKDAVCTADSIEPGAVAVCDVSCSAHSDCASLSSDHRCDGGYCRAPKLGSSGGAGQGAGGSAGLGPAGGGNASAVGGSSAGAVSGGVGGLGGGSALPRIFPCPQETPNGDPIQVERSSLAGNALTLQVGHSGGCGQHRYDLCYGEFLESWPVQTTLTLIHDANGDTCEAFVTQTLTFDLTPLAESYYRGYVTDNGQISTNYGLYGFGNLSCEDRTAVALSQVSELGEYVDVDCGTADDCSYAANHTACSPGCGTLASTRGVAELDRARTAIEQGVCGDFEGAGCGIAVPPCAPPPQLACVAGKCVAERN